MSTLLLKLNYTHKPRIWAYRAIVSVVLALWLILPLLGILKLIGAVSLIYLGSKGPISKLKIIEVHHNKLIFVASASKRLSIKPCRYICTPIFTWIQVNSKPFSKNTSLVFSLFCLQDGAISTLNREIRRICENS